MTPQSTPDLEKLAQAVQELGRNARLQTGASDVALFRRLKRLSRGTEAVGRVLLQLAAGPWSWVGGLLSLAFSLSLESQLNHSVMHGVYVGLPDADDLTPERYESLALPFQSRTWREAHRIHHAFPSLLEVDPDTVHPLFRVHRDKPFRPWHLFNTFLGTLLVFECWAFDYDRFLKRTGHRPPHDRAEIRKFGHFLAYQYLLFPLLAGAHWKQVLLGNFAACIVRNFVFVALQTGSSVGHRVSTLHSHASGKKTRGEWTRFQIESSKNFVLRGYWKTLCGGLDRHIEHHLYPQLPPNRFHALSAELRELCRTHGVAYEEHASLLASLRDSFSYLAKLSLP